MIGRAVPRQQVGTADPGMSSPAAAPVASRLPEEARHSRWAWTAVVAVALLHLIPVWIVPRYPSQDGPSHLYLAWVMHSYAEHPILQEEFVLNLQPFPNWSCYALLQPLLAVSSPYAAEKIVWSLYVLGFPLAYFYLLRAVRRGRHVLGFLAFPFVFGFSMQLGLLNSCLGVPLSLLAMGYWWRHRNRWTWRAALGLDALLLATYFTHFIAFAVALGSILLLAAVTAGEQLRARLRMLVHLLPILPFPLWFMLRTAPPLPGDPVGFRWEKITDLAAVVSIFDQVLVAHLLLGAGGILLGLALAERLRRRASRPGDAFVVLSLVLALATVVVPHDYLVAERLSLYPLLVLVPAVPQPRGRTVTATLGAFLAVVIGLQLMHTLRFVRAADADLEVYLSGMEAVENGSRLYAFSPDLRGSLSDTHLRLLSHAANYYAIDTGSAYLQNLHMQDRNFPVLRRHLDAPREVLATDHLLITWNMPPDFELSPWHATFYEETFASPDRRLRIFEATPR